MSGWQEVIDGLKDFTRKVKNGERIAATRVERHETPDGPMHLSSKIWMRFVDGEKVVEERK